MWSVGVGRFGRRRGVERRALGVFFSCEVCFLENKAVWWCGER